MTRLFPVAFLLTTAFTLGLTAQAQQEGPIPTQALVGVDAKSMPPTDASALTVTVNDRKEPLTSWLPVAPANAQVALLIDDGLRESVGRELDNLRAFVGNLAPGIEVMVGFMQYGHVVAEQPFTTDHAQAASTLRLPEGVPGMSASPYISLSDFVRRWPGSGASASSVTGAGATAHIKARFVIMITNGVDPYNGSTSLSNQNSPYVDTAVSDAQRAGVAVYAIYFGDAGIRGPSADNSGQSYLADLTQRTGGVSYWEGVGNPVSTAPFLAQFQHAIGETYVATFLAPTGKDPQRDMVHVKFTAPKTKLHTSEMVLPGNQE
jgi:hypothetical protein